ncbi:MAG: YgfZ/GcvT domain-containing protein [Acetobacteraceae bacterium]
MLARLEERKVIAIGGEDRLEFLQGLVSNDVAAVAPGRAVWAAMLTPQGRWQTDFFIFSDGSRLLLDVEGKALAELLQRLSRYRLRARVDLQATEMAVHAFWGEGAPPAAALAAPDPRLAAAGWRLLDNAPLVADATAAVWDRHRLGLGLPDGSLDLEAGKTLLLEAGFDELNGVSWTKGCYLGQELTARTKYRALLKRRLFPVAAAGPLPPAGTPVLAAEAEVGTMRSSRDGIGLALLRLDALGAALTAGGQTIEVRRPEWMERAA